MSKPSSTINLTGAGYGFLSPRGSFYRCVYWGHFELAKKLARQWRPNGFEDVRPDGSVPNYSTPDQWLLEHGWLRLSNFQWIGYQQLTQRQIDALWDWCQANKRDFPPTGVDIAEGASSPA